MRAFRPKPFRAKALGKENRDNNEADGERRKAMIAEFQRRIASFKEMWRVCRDGHCRRRRQCVGPSSTCKCDERRWSKRQRWRLRRDIIRNPPQV